MPLMTSLPRLNDKCQSQNRLYFHILNKLIVFFLVVGKSILVRLRIIAPTCYAFARYHRGLSSLAAVRLKRTREANGHDEVKT